MCVMAVLDRNEETKKGFLKKVSDKRGCQMLGIVIGVHPLFQRSLYYLDF